MCDAKSVKTGKVNERRTFLKNAAVVGGVAAAAVSTGSRAASVVPQESEAAADTGYHETKHIRDYYASTRS